MATYKVMYIYCDYGEDCYAECNTLKEAKKAAKKCAEEYFDYTDSIRIDKTETVATIKSAEISILWSDETE